MIFSGGGNDVCGSKDIYFLFHDHNLWLFNVGCRVKTFYFLFHDHNLPLFLTVRASGTVEQDLEI